MLNGRTEKMGLLKYLMASTLLVFIGIVTTSITLAQWPIYSGSFYDSTFPFLNRSSNYSYLFSPYNDFYFPTLSSYFELGFRELESYSNYFDGGGNNSYNNFFPISLNSSPYHQVYNPSVFSGNYNENILRIGTVYYDHDLFVQTPSGAKIPSFPGYIPPGALLGFPPPIPPPQFINSTIPVLNYYNNEQAAPKKPRSAPENMKGEWQSEELTGEEGDLEYDQNENYLNMVGSSLALGNGELTQFKYTSTFGYAPISFKGEFDSGYTVSFSGTAYNARSSATSYVFGPPTYFNIEGKYVIKDGDEVVDRGTFKLTWQGST